MRASLLFIETSLIKKKKKKKQLKIDRKRAFQM